MNTQTHGRTFRLIESIGPEGRCFENIEQSGGASRWRVCYQRGLPRLVSTFSDLHRGKKPMYTFRKILAWTILEQEFSKVWQIMTWIRWLYCHRMLTHMCTWAHMGAHIYACMCSKSHSFSSPYLELTTSLIVSFPPPGDQNTFCYNICLQRLLVSIRGSYIASP